NNSADDTYPQWSPGGRIAFHSNRDGNWEIYVMNPDGSNQTRLTNSAVTEAFASWSPAGTRIAFHSNRNDNWDIYVMNANGSNQVRLTTDPAVDNNPTWSPDGTQIAFHTNRDGNWEVYAMNPDGSNQTNLTNSPGVDAWPQWAAAAQATPTPTPTLTPTPTPIPTPTPGTTPTPTPTPTSTPTPTPTPTQPAVTIQLVEGWNLPSKPMLGTSPANLFAEILDALAIAWALDASVPPDGEWLGFSPGAPSFLNTLTDIDETMGFWLFMDEAATLTMVGAAPASTDIALYGGRWNLIGYPSQQARPVDEVLAGIAYESACTYEAQDVADPWKCNDPDAPALLNDLTEMEPGKGYLIFPKENATLTVEG
ncbi:MAG: TolB family protein, partial [Dehalococcoidia bacterium]